MGGQSESSNLGQFGIGGNIRDAIPELGESVVDAHGSATFFLVGRRPSLDDSSRGIHHLDVITVSMVMMNVVMMVVHHCRRAVHHYPTTHVHIRGGVIHWDFGRCAINGGRHSSVIMVGCVVGPWGLWGDVVVTPPGVQLRVGLRRGVAIVWGVNGPRWIGNMIEILGNETTDETHVD